jgi:hypothetical protein
VIFVDTGAWFAAFIPNDADHKVADAWITTNSEPLVTTDYVVDELLTLLKIRGEFQRAVHLGESIWQDEIADLVWVSQNDVAEAWRVFREFQDKQWSFTDCVSRAVMQRLGIDRAFAFDEHFRQFGTVTVVPVQSNAT